MPIIFETEDFVVKAQDEPHHSRENGGHVVITPKIRYEHRYEMPLDTATRMMHLSMILGEAFTNVMRAKDIDVVRINYQDNGNWAYKEPQKPPQLHIHLYARTMHEKHPKDDPRFQAFPDALVFPDRGTGFYDKFVPLSNEDCAEIKNEVLYLLRSAKYTALESISIN
jgi:diadenosine tetraphosphate (Ap4A) HIT family hydrolase